MRPLIPLAFLVSTLAAAPAPAADDDLAATVTAMARVGRASSPSFSPDGARIAYVADLSGVPQVWIVPATSGYPRQVTALADPVGAVRWSPKGDWLALSVLPGGGLNSQVYVVRPDGTGLRRLTGGGKENNWLGDWLEDGSRLTLASNRRDAAAMDAYLLDAATGRHELIAENPGIGQLTDTSADGRFAILDRVRSRGDNDLYLVDLKTRKETHLTPHEPPAEFAGQLAGDARTVFVTSNDRRDLSALGRIRIGDDGTPGPIEILAERADAELDGFEIDHQGTRAALAWNVAGRSEVAFLDLATGRLTPAPKLPADMVIAVDFSRDDSKMAIVAFGSAATPDVWVLDLAARDGRWTQVTFSPHPGVDMAALIRPELVRYEAHDGLELSGWLYLPRDFRKPGPVVLSFHGGPEGQERPAFRSDYQALLSQGIAVFAPNVRGSSGFGKRFVNLDNGARRVEGVRDIKATADHLVGAGIGDAKRLGIMGGSYGGYMTMAGLTEYPDLFAAGANLFGVVNFATFFKHTEPWMAAISTVEYGDPVKEADMLASLSPIHKLDRIKAATMVLHGANDTNVPVVEAEQIVEHLKKRGVPVEYILFSDEGHGWRKIPNRIRSTVEITRFFARHLKGGTPHLPGPGRARARCPPAATSCATAAFLTHPWGHGSVRRFRRPS
jgi:dipeptidyl aminopeptidase/acylaminoacyl peptidase